MTNMATLRVFGILLVSVSLDTILTDRRSFYLKQHKLLDILIYVTYMIMLTINLECKCLTRMSSRHQKIYYFKLLLSVREWFLLIYQLFFREDNSWRCFGLIMCCWPPWKVIIMCAFVIRVLWYVFCMSATNLNDEAMHPRYWSCRNSKICLG